MGGHPLVDPRPDPGLPQGLPPRQFGVSGGWRAWHAGRLAGRLVWIDGGGDAGMRLDRLSGVQAAVFAVAGADHLDRLGQALCDAPREEPRRAVPAR